MPRQRLTDLSIRKLPTPETGQETYWDATLPGFGVRVSPRGARSFVVMYYTGKRRRRRTIGRHPTISLAEARTAAKQVLASVTLGTHEEEDRTLNVSDALDLFDDLHCKRRNKAGTRKETMRLLNKHIRPALGSDVVSDIKPRDVSAVVDRLMETPGTALHVFMATRKFFNWCIERSYIDRSPCAAMRPPVKLQARDRVLTDDELTAVYTAAKSIGYPYGPFVQLLLLTAQRRSEVASMRWEHLHGETWTIPADLNKSNRPHTVPLTEPVRQLIESLPQFESPYVFPARGNLENPFSGFSKSKRALDNASKANGWRLHDLRRTAATKMAQLNTPPHVIERILNHSTGTLGGVAGIYNRFGYLPEMEAALSCWASHLFGLASEKGSLL